MAETQVASSMISKITMATIKTKPGLVSTLPDGENELPLARLYGTLDNVVYQDDKVSGQIFTSFVGSFEAINMQDGEVYTSGKMFLPKGISDLVESAVKKNPNSAIQFAFEVRAIKANNPAKYSYKVLPLVNPETSDALAELRRRVLSAGTINVKSLTAGQRGQSTTIEGGPQKKSA